MAEPNSGRPPPEAFVVVRDPLQARLLTDPASFRFFEPFIDRDRTVSQAADEIGCRLDTMLYRVKTFLNAGLLAVSRLEKRAGRPIKHYRSSSSAYFVPFEVTPYAGLEERLKAGFEARQEMLVKSLARLLREHGWEGQRIFRSASGEVWTEGAADTARSFDPKDPMTPVVLDFSLTVHLSRDEAKALQLELSRLLERYRDRESRPGQAYTFGVALVPLTG
jgi:hypothetical protein